MFQFFLFHHILITFTNDTVDHIQLLLVPKFLEEQIGVLKDLILFHPTKSEVVFHCQPLALPPSSWAPTVSSQADSMLLPSSNFSAARPAISPSTMMGMNQCSVGSSSWNAYSHSGYTTSMTGTVMLCQCGSELCVLCRFLLVLLALKCELNGQYLLSGDQQCMISEGFQMKLIKR